jgi:hypothetical protein
MARDFSEELISKSSVAEAIVSCCESPLIREEGYRKVRRNAAPGFLNPGWVDAASLFLPSLAPKVRRNAAPGFLNPGWVDAASLFLPFTFHPR